MPLARGAPAHRARQRRGHALLHGLLAFASAHWAWLLALVGGGLAAHATAELATLGAPLLVLLALLLVAAALLLPAALLILSYLADERAPQRAAPLRMRPLAFTEPARWARRQRELGRPRPPPPPLHPSSKAVSEAADALLALVLRDFVSAWHKPLSLGGAPPGEAAPSDFPQAVEAALRASLARTLERTADVDVATLGVRRLLPIVTAHMAAHRHATAQLRGAASELSPANSTAEDDVFLARAYNDGVLHPAVGAIASADTRHSERAHLRALVERALRIILPSRESASPAVWTVARELVACTVLLPVIDALSDPDTLNALLDQKVRADAAHTRQHDTNITSTRPELLCKNSETAWPLSLTCRSDPCRTGSSLVACATRWTRSRRPCQAETAPAARPRRGRPFWGKVLPSPRGRWTRSRAPSRRSSLRLKR